MGAVKNFYHDDLERRRAIENERCGQCGEDADLNTEAWHHGLCRGCFNEANGQFGVGA
jgi:ribosomal protein S14